MLAGRLRRNNKATRWEIDIPPHPVPTGYVTHTLTRSTIYASLPLPPKPTASAAFLVPALPLSHFRHSASPTRSVSYASKNKPFLAIHVSVLPNCICVGISLPHGVVDATGFGMVVSALDAELNGREWEVPSSRR